MNIESRKTDPDKLYSEFYGEPLKIRSQAAK